MSNTWDHVFDAVHAFNTEGDGAFRVRLSAVHKISMDKPGSARTLAAITDCLSRAQLWEVFCMRAGGCKNLHATNIGCPACKVICTQQ